MKQRQNKKTIFVVTILIILIGISIVSADFISSTSSSSSSFNTGATSYSSLAAPSSTVGDVYSSGYLGGTRIYGSSSNPQYNSPGFLSTAGFTDPSVYWPNFNSQDCFARQDFLMQIAPGGCSPAVVRSDLLEEQNVPVFCKVMALQVNPLIDVSRIRSLHFSGQYPPGISGLSYFPARAAVNSQTNLVSSPVKDNLGYLVVVLSKVDAEKNMPDAIRANVTATIDYDTEKSLGIGQNEFYLSEIREDEWSNNYKQYGFWNGRGYIRLDSVYNNQAVVSIYRDKDSKQSTLNLKTGETSKDIYLSGFFCSAGMNIRLDSIGAPVETALVQINEQQMWVAKGDHIMDSKCTVTNLYTYNGGGRVSISCPVQNGRFDLSLNPGKATINVNGVDTDVAVGERIEADKNLYLGYVGQDLSGNNFAVIVNDSYSFTENEFD